VSAFVQSGGRALLQYWNLAGDSALATAFQVSAPQQITQAMSAHDWGGSKLFLGLNTPLVLTSFTANTIVHGQKLQPLAGAQAVAGFVGSATANEAALVIGHSGRTIVQGFYIEDVELNEDYLQFAQNELDFLFGPIAPDTGPAIVADPKTQTVLVGGSTTLRVQASGKAPLSFQWQQDGTNLPGATNAFLSFSNAALDQAGSYRVTVSNHHFAVVSGAAILTVTQPSPVANILLHVDNGTFPCPYESVLITLGLAYQKHSDHTVFNAAVAAANPAYTLVILDSYASPWRYSELVGFVRAGGRALMQNWNLIAGSYLAGAFHVEVAQHNHTILPVYSWAGTDFFAGFNSPLDLGPLSPSPSVHGQKLQPIAGGQAVAGFIGSPANNEAAMVIGNAGRTLVNGFMLEEIVSVSERSQLAQRQVLHFFAPPPTPITVFADDFDADSSAQWIVSRSSADTRVTFHYDYAADGIPPAPRSLGATTRGVKFEANLNSGIPAALNISPVGGNFAGDYWLEFDLWINANGPFPAGGVGSTEHFTAGIGTSGDRVHWNGLDAATNGYWFAVNGEGGSSDTATTALPDFMAFSRALLHGAASGVYTAGTAANSRGNGHPYYTNAFPTGQVAPLFQRSSYPQQTGGLRVGAVGLAWRQAVIKKQDTKVEWFLDGLKIATITNTAFVASNVFLGYWDGFASLSDNAALSFGLVDNVRVREAAPGLRMLSTTWADGQCQVGLSGPPGLPCALQQSSNLADWMTITNFTLPAEPMVLTVPAPAAHGFFRLLAN
jgi:hypothetical protein